MTDALTVARSRLEANGLTFRPARKPDHQAAPLSDMTAEQLVAWAQGYCAGHDTGHAAGYAEGHAEGHAAGLREYDAELVAALAFALSGGATTDRREAVRRHLRDFQPIGPREPREPRHDDA